MLSKKQPFFSVIYGPIWEYYGSLRTYNIYMNKKQLMIELKRSSTIIKTVSETDHSFDVFVTGKKRKRQVSTVKEILLSFITEQKTFNSEQKTFNSEVREFMVEQKDFNQRIEVKVDNNTKMIEKNHSMIKTSHPELFS